MRLELAVPPAARAGAPVLLSLRLTNLTDYPVTLYLRGRMIAFDFVIRDRQGRIVWRRLATDPVPALPRAETLASRATISLDHEWNQRDEGGKPVAAGLYSIEGAVLTDGTPLRSGVASLRIRRWL